MPPTQRDIQRITALDEQLALLDEKRHAFETEIAISASTNATFELRQRLKRDVLPSLRRLEEEYAALLAQAVEPAQLPDTEAHAVLADVRGALEAPAPATSGEPPAEVRRLLTEIRAKLDDPEQAAAAKLKVVLPLIPLIASYELEFDTGALWGKVWQRAKGFFRDRVSPPPP